MNLLQKIKNRTATQGDCLVWQTKCKHKHPTIFHDGKTRMVRRALWEKAHGPIPDGFVVQMTCTTTKCIDEKCMKLHTHADDAKQSAYAKRGDLLPKKPPAKRIPHKRPMLAGIAPRPVILSGFSHQISQHKAQREALGVWAGL